MSTLQRAPGDRVRIFDESGTVVGDLPAISDERIADGIREVIEF